MKTRLCLLLASVLLVTGLQADNEVYRTWTDTQGRKLEATFRGIENGNVFLQVRNGYVYRLSLDKLSAADQEAARTLKPEGLGIPSDPNLAQAAAQIDMLVEAGLKKVEQKPNPLASDEQFVRRVFLDLAGRIPTREESLEFLNDTSLSKRAKVIDRLLESEGYRSHLFNYFADMLRMADVAQKARFYTYQDWLKGQIAENVPWNKVVYSMMTADGKLLENGATGYLLRDAGMRLDNLSLTLSTFIGANVSCAQCHDHPFADWTQRQFYEMAAFFGATETYGARGAKGPEAQMMRKALASLDDKRMQQQAKNLLRVNGLAVNDSSTNDLKMPDDYKYPDAKPGDLVTPKLITWSDDKAKKAYQGVQTTKNDEQLREQFAKWMTSPDNPRFAMTIANRMWKHIFGIGVKEPVTDIDDPNASVNPALLHHLANEMVRLKFDLKQFLRVLCNTDTYQREATSHELADNTAYHFPGPILRRMTAEQAWDSCATLVVGADVDKFKGHRGETYAKAMNIDFSKEASPDVVKGQIENAIASMRQFGGGKAAGNPKNRKKRMMNQGGEEDLTLAPPVRDGLVLARASELPQPEKDQHFLRMFGQSDRQIADSESEEGSIPQVLMLMNGEAQRVIGQNDSLVVKTASAQKTPEQQVESLYLSFFSRKPKPDELATATAGLSNGMTMRDLTWVLFNTREFIFVE
ncbi:MAG: DUF1549 and DUF1553 domain-containing protein [Prosthecobacter sp.]|uniref:DUF1549 domain-containing protein n=1 Tax=Prosthecobacter sp. TaxID=1965333 RepID=UPI002600864C|nr:DUF1549 domain-containing protein [Prosthecobacter sp.]MCF7788062.1 DUF1549 and DUF1553 domain-containing protein [Prosthecobacter sp.]